MIPILRAPKNCRCSDACMRKFFKNLLKICTFERKTGKTGTFV